MSILQKYRSQLEKGAKPLLEKGKLAREELLSLEEHNPAVAAAAKVTRWQICDALYAD